MLCNLFSLPRYDFYYYKNKDSDLCGFINNRLDKFIIKIRDKSKLLNSPRKIRDLLESEGIMVSQKKVSKRIKYLRENNIID